MEFGREVLAQTLGTALGAGLVALVVKIVGGLGRVPWGTVAGAAALLVGLIALGVELNRPLSRKIADLKGEACPNCGEVIPVPIAWHGIPGHSMHSNLDCSKCHRPLVYFVEGVLAGEWTIDEPEERRRKLAAEDE